MGQIQQAFNQSMATAAYFAQPAAIHKKDVEVAEKAAKYASKQAEEKAEITATTKGEADIQVKAYELAQEEATKKAAAAYQKNPTEENLRRYAEEADIKEERIRNEATLAPGGATLVKKPNPAQVAFEKTKTTKEQYKDQLANLHKLKWQMKKEARKK